MTTNTRRYLNTKSLFTISILVIFLTILGVLLFGLGKEKSLFEVSLLSTSILSLAFFLFLTIGLYKGVKLKDNLGKITDRIRSENFPDIANRLDMTSVADDIGDGEEGIIVGIISWILFSIILILFLWFFSAILWSIILVFMAMLYWIFFRALRLVFKNANKCKANLVMSVQYGLGYTILYNFWIYMIIFISHYL